MPSEIIYLELGINFTINHNISGEIKYTVDNKMSN